MLRQPAVWFDPSPRDMIIEHQERNHMSPNADAWHSLVFFSNATRRGIEPRPRPVFKSRDLERRILNADHHQAIDQILAASLAGKNLNPYLSRKLLDATYSDPLLNDWGIHHLHLGLSVESDGFVERDDSLLFAVVRDDGLYLLDTLAHGAWTDNSLVEIIHTNWPELIASYKAPGAKIEPIPEARRKLYRDHGLTTLT